MRYEAKVLLLFLKLKKYESNIYVYLSGRCRFFAHHGVDPQETIVGANFIIDLRLRTDFTHAAQTDELKGTVSYADIYAVVKKEMKTPSKLLEHVCERIGQRLFNDFPTIQEIIIRLSKENPPMGSDCRNVGAEVHYTR